MIGCFDGLTRLLETGYDGEENGEVCPANWSEGEKAMTASFDGVRDYMG